jgi:RNA polymerase sigma-70 factor (ECF subfamily)
VAPEALLLHDERHRERLIAALARLVRREEAEELANETLIRALSSAESFRGEADAYTWLYRIALNLAYDLLRRQKRHPEVSMDEEIENLERVPAHGDPSALKKREMSQCVRNLLTTLPPEQHEVLIHADIHDATASEIARNTGVSTGNAKIRLHRARRAMKSILEKHCDLELEADGVCRCTPKAVQ